MAVQIAVALHPPQNAAMFISGIYPHFAGIDDFVRA